MKAFNVDAEALYTAFGQTDERSLRRRRWIAGLCAVGLADFAIIALHQTGVIRHLPDPPGRLFNSDKVTTSARAFATGVPDGMLGAFLSATTMLLATAARTRNPERRRVFNWLLAGAAIAGAAGALDGLRDTISKQRKACVYCLAGAAINLSVLPLALKELRRQ
ncbi:MAG TPA: vitamin K epoxide reductase family protein [Myxococcales bacterium]|jgi:uncharacterized membrane protein